MAEEENVKENADAKTENSQKVILTMLKDKAQLLKLKIATFLGSGRRGGRWEGEERRRRREEGAGGRKEMLREMQLRMIT